MIHKKWIPLEANPDVLNLFLTKLGVTQFEFVDILGLDQELLAMVPKNAIAVILLVPLTENYDIYRKGLSQNSVPGLATTESMFIPQTISNACGTMAVLHALLNNTKHIQIESIPDSIISKLHRDLQLITTSIKDRVEYLENGPGYDLVCKAHAQVAQLGQTTPPDISESIDLHFVSFVSQQGMIMEYDGRLPGPVPHSAPYVPVEEFLLENVAEVAKEFMARDPDNLQFSLMALVPKQ